MTDELVTPEHVLALRWIPDVTSWEVSWGRSIAGWPRWVGWPLEVVMQAGTRWFVVVVAVGLLAARQLRPAIAVALAGATAWASSHLLKEWFDRPRPTAGELQRPLRELASGNGFPSGHAAVSTALVVVLVAAVTLRRPAWTWPVVVAALTVAVMTSLARIYVGAHWPLDVVGGAVLGAFCGTLATAILLRPTPDRARVSVSTNVNAH